MAASAPSTWPGPALFVPIALEALGITDRAQYAAWSWSPPKYPFLGTFLDVDPTPFDPTQPTLRGNALFKGVMLHWALPDALTHGVSLPTGEIAYPNIPNRWLVVRKSRNQADLTAWAYQAWVIASDYVDPSTGGAGSPFPNDQGTGQTYIGKAWTLDQWPGEPAVSARCLKTPLTAVGPGDPTFAAFVPNVPSVVSFMDTLSDVSTGPLTYSVYGWYSKPEYDPLYGRAQFGSGGWQTEEQWQTLMDYFKWSVGDDQDLTAACKATELWAQAHGFAVDPGNPRTQFPSRTICHGLIFNVTWQGPGGPFLSGVPTSDFTAVDYVEPQIAIANSSIDALVALIADADWKQHKDDKAKSQLVDILEAFQYNSLHVLDTADGQDQLDLLIEKGWFNSTAGGTNWSVVAPQDYTSPGGSDQPPPLTPLQATLLTQLNTAQHGFDSCRWELSALQWQLYALWWKKNRLLHAPGTQPVKDQLNKLIDDATTAAQAAISSQLNGYRVLRQQRDDALLQLQPTLGENRLVAGARPPFWRPNEPVLMISGTRRSYKHGEDGRFNPDGTLFCRFTGQTVSGIAVRVDSGEKIVGAGDVPLPGVNNPDLPLETGDLDAESFFLDTSNAPMIAFAADRAHPWTHLEAIRKEQTLVWNSALHPALDKQTIDELSGIQTMYSLGAIPSKIGVEVWSPPWSPLYIDWQLSFYPGSADQSTALENWTFTPGATSGDPLNRFTYRWSGPEPSSKQTSFTISGRTLLTPQATDVLAYQLEQVIENYGSEPSTQAYLPQLQEALTYIQNADLLSQALSGFNLTLLERDPQTSRTPAQTDPGLAPYLYPTLEPQVVIDSVPSPGPLPSTSADAAPAAPADNPADLSLLSFNPIRGAHAKLTKLWVVDGFGQVFDVMGAQSQNTPPVLCIELTTPQASGVAELKPRISQFARLNFDLLSADNDSEIVGVAAGVNPLCGWLIPNYLDRGVLVYDASGTLQGELLLAEDRALWLPPPDAAPPPGGGPPDVKIANRHLHDLVTGIYRAPDSHQALREFLAVVDKVRWSLYGSGEWADEELPVLIGTPLAVVRARLALELMGGPAYSQLWSDTGKQVTQGFDTVSFPVQLGSTELLDDGLVGFYLNDNYRQINSVYSVEEGGGESGKSGAGAYVGAALARLSLDGASAALLTLVLDPQTKAHAISGIFPSQSITLPGSFATPALDKMEVTFRVGPVINDPSGVAMPLPALSEGLWTWLQYANTTTPARERAVQPAGPQASLPNVPPVLNEGWLKLNLAGQMTRFTYSISPTSVLYTRNPANPSTALLQFNVYNGSGEDVTWSQLAFSLPVGEGADAITARPDLIAVDVPAGSPWRASNDGGTITITPVDGILVLAKGKALNFSIASVQVNEAAGVAQITISESADDTRHTSLGVVKVAGSRQSTRLMYSAIPSTVRCSTHTAPSVVSLQLGVANTTGAHVDCSEITFTLPVGVCDGELTSDPASITVSAAPGTDWLVRADGRGNVVATPAPPATGLDNGESVGFIVGNIQVNEIPGTASIAIRENTDVARNGAVSVTKGSY